MLAGLFLLLWGIKNPQIALMLMEHPRLILPYLIDKFGYLKLIGGTLGIGGFFWLLLISSNSNTHVCKKMPNISPGSDFLLLIN